MGSQNVHVVNIKGFFKILVDLSQKYFFDLIMGKSMRNSKGRRGITVIRSVLEEAIHDMIPFWTECLIENRGNRDIHKRVCTNS